MAIYFEGKVTKIRRRWNKVSFTYEDHRGSMRYTIPRERFPENAREGDKVSYISPGGMASGQLPDGTAYFAQNIGPEDAYFTLCKVEDLNKPNLKLPVGKKWLEKLQRLLRNDRS